MVFATELESALRFGPAPTVTLVAKSFSGGHTAAWRAANHEQRIWAVGMPFTQFDHHFQTPRLRASKAAAYKRSVMQLSGARTVPKKQDEG